MTINLPLIDNKSIHTLQLPEVGIDYFQQLVYRMNGNPTAKYGLQETYLL